jgi:DNA-binding LytR/AlgR family response regulator
MSRLKTLLVHPDAAIRAQIRQLLDPVKEITILGEAVTSFEAMGLLAYVPYDVLFLGMELPHGVSGMDLARHLSGRSPAIVFVAETEQHAFEAFELGAVDYLRWPPPPGRFQRTVERLRALVPAPTTVSPAPHPSRPLRAESEETVQLALAEDEEDVLVDALRQAWDPAQTRPLEIEKLPVNQDGRHILIPYTQIVYVEAYEDYSFVHTATERYLTSYRLKNLEARLGPHGFCRVHRKYLVNLDMVTEIASMPGGNFLLRTAGRKRIELPVSRRRVGELKKILQF